LVRCLQTKINERYLLLRGTGAGARPLNQLKLQEYFPGIHRTKSDYWESITGSTDFYAASVKLVQDYNQG